MEAERVGAIRARLNLVTDGPWQAISFGPGEPVTIQADFPGQPTPLARVFGGSYRAEAMALSGRFVGTVEDDARFFLHSREDVGFLLGEFDAAHGLLAAAEARLASVENRHRESQITALFAALIFAGLTLVGGLLLGLTL